MTTSRRGPMRYGVRTSGVPGWSSTPIMPSWPAALAYQARAISATTLTDALPPIPASRADLSAMADSAYVLVTRAYELDHLGRALTSLERLERRALGRQALDAVLWLLARSDNDDYRRLARLHKDT